MLQLHTHPPCEGEAVGEYSLDHYPLAAPSIVIVECLMIDLEGTNHILSWISSPCTGFSAALLLFSHSIS